MVCYSDHNEDIRTKGSCDYCGGHEPDDARNEDQLLMSIHPEPQIFVLPSAEVFCQGCGGSKKALNSKFMCAGCMAIQSLVAENTQLRTRIAELEASAKKAQDEIHLLRQELLEWESERPTWR